MLQLVNDAFIAHDDAVGLLRRRLDALARAPKRVLLVPPDHTRLYSAAGPLTVWLYGELSARGAEVEVMPALGTHRAMTPENLARMFGPGIPPDAFRVHDFRRGTVVLGEVPGEIVREASGGKLDYAIPVAVNRLLAEGGHDLVVSLGQVVPHEVSGMANHAKNLLVGLGGADFIHRSHFLGATAGIEATLGRTDSPVRRVFDYAARRFLAHLPIDYVLTVVAPPGDGRDPGDDAVGGAGSGLALRGLFVGPERGGFEAAAELSRRLNVQWLDEPLSRAVAYLPPEEFTSTWLGNKAIYRTRLAMADGGELLILAPAVDTFGEDPEIDALIRRVGYKGTPRVLRALEKDAALAANLSAAATLIHGSTEGRFRVVYATDPDLLAPEAVEGVGFGWRDVREAMAEYPPAALKDGWHTAADGGRYYYFSNPALGLWATRRRFDAATEVVN